MKSPSEIIRNLIESADYMQEAEQFDSVEERVGSMIYDAMVQDPSIKFTLNKKPMIMEGILTFDVDGKRYVIEIREGKRRF